MIGWVQRQTAMAIRGKAKDGFAVARLFCEPPWFAEAEYSVVLRRHSSEQYGNAKARHRTVTRRRRETGMSIAMAEQRVVAKRKGKGQRGCTRKRIAVACRCDQRYGTAEAK